MQSDRGLESLAIQTRALLTSLVAANARLATFVALLPASPAAPPQALALAAPLAPLAVLRWLPPMAEQPLGFAQALIGALCQVAPQLHWRQTYTVADLGAHFIQGYGYTEIIGINAPIPSQRIACGFLLLGPNVLYPSHRHEAEEIYLPLSGAARWQQGEALWRKRSPGAIIHHESEEPHAMHTDTQPLLAMYLWRSDNLNQSARLDNRGSARELLG